MKMLKVQDYSTMCGNEDDCDGGEDCRKRCTTEVGDEKNCQRCYCRVCTKSNYCNRRRMFKEVKEKPHKVVIIKKVEVASDGDFSVTNDDGLSFFVFAKHGVKPEVGMTMTYWGEGDFRRVRGVALNDRLLYYHTVAEQDKLDKERHIQMENDEKAKFEKNKAKLDADYDALPEHFRRRVDKFRANNPDFRWKYEAYELFCCKEAVKIINAVAYGPPEPFGDLSREDFMEARIPTKMRERLDRDVFKLNMSDHSGNTYGMAYYLARLYLKDKELIVKVHGALAPLVGSDEYGCVPRKAKK